MERSRGCEGERRSEGVTEWCGNDIEECVRESTYILFLSLLHELYICTYVEDNVN